MSRGLLLAVLFLCGIILRAQDEVVRITFDAALEATLNNNEVLQQAVWQKRQAESEWKAVRSLRLPQLTLSLNYVKLSDDITIDMHGVRDAITPLYGAMSQYGVFSGVPNPDPATSGAMPVLPDNVSTQIVRQQLADGLVKVENAEWDKLIQKSQFGMMSAGVTWPLFTGGKIKAANAAAKIKINEAAEVERQKTGELMSELVERYFGLALALEAEQVRSEVLSAMEAHLSDAEKLYKEGMLPKAEFLHAQVYHAQADREYKKSVRDRRVINEALANSMAQSPELSYQPLTSLFYNHSIESATFFKLQAQASNPLLQQVAAKKNLAHQATRAERSGMLPTVAAFGSYNIANVDLSPNISDYMAGITLSWKIFGGTSARHKYQSARFVEEQVGQVRSKAVRDLGMGIEKYHQEIQMILEQLHELVTAEAFADEYYRVRKKAFNEGMATSTEVTDASLAAAKVRIEKLEAMYQYDVALARLLELAGIPEYFPNYLAKNGQ
ncbi:Outer membrane protein TolC [Saccharicrinis carchari]|uniref:Outer membrane protein TolC n=1 Tax=Saccharicrinis carchari TaxID=1168039 RepID=A0A521DDZ0_SACCC|nr:TolC family protein [Saccharicrinis carchari]SMO69909.1 Outer membrane protein TolC [Saccharicrinis carchari]